MGIADRLKRQEEEKQNSKLYQLIQTDDEARNARWGEQAKQEERATSAYDLALKMLQDDEDYNNSLEGRTGIGANEHSWKSTMQSIYANKMLKDNKGTIDSKLGAGATDMLRTAVNGTAIEASQNAYAQNRKSEINKLRRQFKSDDEFNDYLEGIAIGWTNGQYDPERAEFRKQRRDRQESKVNDITAELESIDRAYYDPTYEGYVGNADSDRFAALEARRNELMDERERLEADINKYDRFQAPLDRYNSGTSTFYAQAEEYKRTHPNDPVTQYLTSQNESNAVHKGSGTYNDPMIAPKSGRQKIFEGGLGLDTENHTVGNIQSHPEWNELTEEELNIYYGLAATQGEESARRWLDSMSNVLGMRRSEEYQKNLKETNTIERILLTAAQTPQRLASRSLAGAEDLANMFTGKGVNPYTGANLTMKQSEATIGAAAEGLDNDLKFNILGQTPGKIYQGIVSGIDSFAQMMIGQVFGSAHLGEIGMALGAGAAEAAELWEKGVGNDTVLARSILAGAFEALFEHMSIEKFTQNFLESPITGWADIAKKTGVQVLTEGSEEVFTDGANFLSDLIHLRSQSEWAEMFQRKKAQGLTDGQAIWQSLLEEGSNLVDSFMGGVYGAFLSSGGGAMAQTWQNRNTGSQIISEGTAETLRKTAEELAGAEGLGEQYAQAISKTTENVGKKATPSRVGYMYNAVENAINEGFGDNAEAALKAGTKVLKSLEKSTDIRTAETSDGQTVTIDENNPIARFEDGKAILNTSNGEMSVDDLSFADDSARLAYDNVNTYDVETANAVLNNYQNGDIARYLAGMREGIELHGKMNVPSEAVSYYSTLSEENQRYARSIGQTMRQTIVNKAVQAAKTGTVTEFRPTSDMTLVGEAKRKGAAGTKGAFYTLGDVSESLPSYKENRDFTVAAAAVTGLPVVAYDSNTVQDEQLKNANGKYVWKNGAIYVDFNAGPVNGKKGLVAFALSHELTHFAEQWSPEDYKTYADWLVSTYSGKGGSMEALVKARMASEGTSYEEAYHDVIADFSERMLLDSDVLEKLEALREKGKTVWQRIVDKIRTLVNRIIGAYGDENQTYESNAIRDLLNSEELQKMKELWSTAVVEGAKNRAAAVQRTETSRANEEIVSAMETPVQFSIKQRDRIAKLSEEAAEKRKDELTFDPALVTTAENQIDRLAGIIENELADKKDKNGQPLIPEEETLSSNIFDNDSYLKDAEPTTECWRQMVYRALNRKVTDMLKRPLTEKEAIVLNQAAIEIGVDAPCIYCYSLLDRKAKEGYKLKYLAERDAFLKLIDKEFRGNVERFRKNRDKVFRKYYYDTYLSRVNDPNAYDEQGRKKGSKRSESKDKETRVNLWFDVYENLYANGQMLSAEDIRNYESESETREAFSKISDEKLRELKLAELEDSVKWAQDSSQAKKIIPYAAYSNFGSDSILKWTPALVKKLNGEYGLRWYSHADYHPAFTIDNMQQVVDASIRGLKGLMYCKPIEIAQIMAPTGMNINVSCFSMYDEKTGKYVQDDRLGAPWKEVQELRKNHPNVGAVMVVSSDEQMFWALSQDWIDVVIPIHLVRSGHEFIKEFGLTNYTAESSDKLTDAQLYDKFIADLVASRSDLDDNKALRKSKKSIYPVEHQNDYETYMRAIEERGLTPRFDRIRQMVLNGEAQYDGITLTPDMYMKLVNETRQSERDTKPLKPVFDYKAAENAINGLAEKGYNDFFKEAATNPEDGKSYDVDGWAKIVARDIRAGKTGSQVGYGRDLKTEVTSSEEARRMGLGGIHDKASMSRKVTPAENARYEGDIRYSAKKASALYRTENDFREAMPLNQFREAIKKESAAESYFPKGLSSNFLKAISQKSLFNKTKVYRGIDANEMDYLIENKFLKSNGSYNFQNQQGQTLGDEDPGYAISYATGFAPKEIADRHYKDGQPSYLVEYLNSPDLNIKKNSVQESYTYGDIDQKYITRIFEIEYDQEKKTDMVRDVTEEMRKMLPNMGEALSENAHGEPLFYRDKTTGTILYAVQGEDGWEDGRYLSQYNADENPGFPTAFTYDRIKSGVLSRHAPRLFAISGNESDLVPLKVGQDGTLVPENSERYSRKQATSYSTRAVVERALKTLPEGAEKKALTEYKQTLDSYDAERMAYNAAVQAGDQDNITRAKNNMKTLSAKLERMENGKSLQNIAAVKDVKALNEDAKDLREMLRAQATETGGTVASKASAKLAADSLAERHNITKGKGELADLISELYTEVMTGVNNGAYNREQVLDMARSVSEWIYEKSNEEWEKANRKEDPEVKEVLNYIKGSRVRINENQKGDIRSRYDGKLIKWMGKLSGYVRVANNATMTLDELWNDLSKQYPHIFDRNASDANEGVLLADIISDLKSRRYVTEQDIEPNTEEYEDHIRDISEEVINALWEVKPQLTIADRYAKKIESLRERHKERMRETRRTFEQTIREQREASWQRGKEVAEARQKRRELRTRIKALMTNLSNRLVNPKVGKYVPMNLQQPVAEVLSMIDTDTGRSERASAKLSALYFAYENIKNDPKYAAYRNVYDPAVSEMMRRVTTAVTEMEKVNAKYGRTGIYSRETEKGKSTGTVDTQLSIRLLENLYEALKQFDTVIKDSVNVHGLGSALDETLSTHEVGQKLIEEVRTENRKKSNLRKALLRGIHLTPDSFFNRLAGHKKDSFWSRVYKMIDNAQTKQLRIEMESNAIFREILKDQKYLRDITNTKKTYDVGLKDANGNPVLLTKDMLLTLYKHLQNEDNTRHIIVGGLNLPNLASYYKNQENAYNGEERMPGFVGEELAAKYKAIEEESEALEDAWEAAAVNNDQEKMARIEEKLKPMREEADAIIRKGEKQARELLKNIEEQLDDKDRKFIEMSNEYFDEYSKNVLNEATMAMYGFEKAKVKNYFPIHVDSAFLKSSFDEIKKDFSLENSGFMKDRQKGASNPLYLEGFTTAVNQQIEKVARYAGLAPALKEFEKLYGVSTGGVTYNDSVKKAIGNVFGQAGTDYIEKLVADLNGNSRQKLQPWERFFQKARGRFAQGVLGVNAGVALKQRVSYLAAASELDYESLTKALLVPEKGTFIFQGKERRQNADELIAKWLPQLWKRSEGFIDVAMGEVRNVNQLRNRVNSKLNFLLGWIQASDISTVRRLWYASEYYVRDHTDLAPESDEYYRAVAEKYRDVIEKTQPNYTTLQRPAILRTNSEFIKSLTMFMTQRLQNFNIVYDSVLTANKYARDKKNGRNGVTEEDVHEARMRAYRAVSSQLGAAVGMAAINFLSGVVLFGRGKKWKDEDGEVTANSALLGMLDDFLSSLCSNVVGGGEIYGIISSIVKGEKWKDGFSIGGLDTIEDAITSFSDALVKVRNGKELTSADWVKIGGNVCTMFGIPGANAYKLARGLKNNLEGTIRGMEVDGEVWELGVTPDRTDDQNGRRMLNAFLEGNDEKFENLEAEFGSQSKAESAFIDALYEANRNGEITDDQVSDALEYIGYDDFDIGKVGEKWEGKDLSAREEELYDEWEQGMSFDDLVKTLADEGHELSKWDQHVMLGEWTAKKETGEKSNFVWAEELDEALEGYMRDTSTGSNMKSVIKQYREWGCEDSKLDDRVGYLFRDKYKAAYRESKTKASTLKGRIIVMLKECGRTEKKATDLIKQWEKDAAKK